MGDSVINLSENFYAEAREAMVAGQITARGIRDPLVLEAMRRVPRELFVTPNLVNRAFEDCPLPLLCGQTISQPYMVAAMSELLAIPTDGNARILEVGTGSGYQAAVIAFMGCEVVSIERFPELAEFARNNLAQIPYAKNIKILLADGSLGCPEEAPFDGIIVTAAAPKIPPSLLGQLKTGGKLVIPCGNPVLQELLQVTKHEDGRLETRECMGCRFVPLIGKEGFRY